MIVWIKWLFGLFNIFRPFLDHKVRILEAQHRHEYALATEKQQEREAFMAAMQAMTQVATESAKASQAQAEALKAFLESFNTTAPPKRMEWDQEEADKRYIREHAPELADMGQRDQLEALLSKLDLDI